MTTDTFHDDRPARPQPSRRRSALALTLALSALASIGAACGDDEAAVKVGACDAAVAYGAAFAEAPEEPTEFPAYAKERLMPIGAALERNLEGDAKKAATTLRTTFAEVAESGDPGALEAPDAAAARTAIGKAVHDGCGLQKVAVRAVEYMYLGAPETLKSGRVSFAMRNEGVEEHEMVLFKRADGVTESLDQLLEMPEEEMGAKLAFTGVTFGAPKTTNYVAVDLEPGTYFLICFIPQGGNDGPPHFMGGMKETIVVS